MKNREHLYRRMSVAGKMPPLHHKMPDQPFQWEDSEVIRWLMSQPQIQAYIFDKAIKYIRYDSSTGTWQGVDYEG